MKNVISKPKPSHPAIESNSHLFDDWFDPIENMIRGQVRGLIEEMIRGELRGGSGCLNRIPALISGASADVKLPCGSAAG